jgi:hypothetical protein
MLIIFFAGSIGIMFCSSPSSCAASVLYSLTRIYTGGYSSLMIALFVPTISCGSNVMLTISPCAPFATLRCMSIFVVNITFRPSANSTWYGRLFLGCQPFCLCSRLDASAYCSTNVNAYPFTVSYAGPMNNVDTVAMQCLHIIASFRQLHTTC